MSRGLERDVVSGMANENWEILVTTRLQHPLEARVGLCPLFLVGDKSESHLEIPDVFN